MELKIEGEKNHKLLEKHYFSKIKMCVFIRILCIFSIIFATTTFIVTFSLNNVLSFILNFLGMIIKIESSKILFKFFGKQKEQFEFSLHHRKEYIDEEIAKAEFDKEFHNK